MRHAFFLILALSGCGASAKQVFHVDPDDNVGDVVSGSPTAPQSPGINGPSTPGGPGAGGGTQAPKSSTPLTVGH